MIIGKLTNDGRQPRLRDKELASEDSNEEPHLDEAEGSEEALQPSEVPTRENLERVPAEG